MRLLALDDATVDANFKWIIYTHLQAFDQIVCGTPVSKADQPGMDEAEAALHRAIARRDAAAEDEALGDMTRAHLMGWWQDFSEQQLLTALYARSERRRAKSGSPDSRRTPDHPEGLRVARALLADIHVIGPLDVVWEAAAITKALADLYFPPLSVRSRYLVRGYIHSSRSTQVFFDALHLICAELENRGEAIGGQLFSCRQAVADGRLRRPRRKPIPARRPAKPSQFARDIQLQLTIEILDRVGVPPWGNPASGCRIVAEASPLPIDTIERIWKECPWKTSFASMLQKYAKDVAERHLLR